MTDANPGVIFETVNPATLLPGASYPAHSAQDAALKVAGAAEAQKHWRRTGFDKRALLMTAAATVLRARRDELAALMTN